MPGGAESGATAELRGPYAYFPTLTKPVLAALNGVTAAFARRGLIAEHGVSWMLPRLVGLQNALDLLLSARKIDAHDALRMGLVSQVLPAPSLMPGVLGYARELADFVSPRSMGVITVSYT